MEAKGRKCQENQRNVKTEAEAVSLGKEPEESDPNRAQLGFASGDTGRVRDAIGGAQGEFGS